MIIPKGTILVTTSGDSFDGPFLALKDIERGEVVRLFREEKLGPESPARLVAWLFINGYIEDVKGAVRWRLV